MIRSPLPDVGQVARSTLSMNDIDLVAEAFRHASVALMGFQNQPRANAGADLTPGGEIIADMSAWLAEHADLIAGAAVTLQPANPADAEQRAWVLLRRAVEMHDDLFETAALGARMLVEVRGAEWIERRQRRAA